MASAADQRRKRIVEILEAADAPVSGADLGKRLGVTRQVIVQDVTVLRHMGHGIEATNLGYVLKPAFDGPTRLFKVRHAADQTEDELNAMVDLGAEVVDVQVNHRTYGLVSARLGLRNRRDVRRFLSELESGVSTPLLTLTDGYHFHHVTAESEAVLDEVEQMLRERSYLADLTDYERRSMNG